MADKIYTAHEKNTLIAEAVLDTKTNKTVLAVCAPDTVIKLQQTATINGNLYEPVSANDPIVASGLAHLSPTPLVGKVPELLESLLLEIVEHILKYVQVNRDEAFLIAAFILMTYQTERFDSVPYLRIRGDYGTGKSRLMMVAGDLANRPIFASGSSTLSPLFRTMDQVRGTLVIDEADFDRSDASSSIVKMLNVGISRNTPLTRTKGRNGEFSVETFAVFGPKILVTRYDFQDDALESRCITIDMPGGAIADHIPLSLSGTSYTDEVDALRVKLITHRLQNFFCEEPAPTIELSGPVRTPRIKQLMLPLVFGLSNSFDLLEAVERYIDSLNRHLMDNDAMTIEHAIVSELVMARSNGSTNIPIGDIAKAVSKNGYHGAVTARQVGHLLRNNMHMTISTRTSTGFSVPINENAVRINALQSRYQIK